MGGEYLRDFLTIAFSHPAVKSFLFWGYWERNHWLEDAPMIRDDWSLKPSGEAFNDLVFREWWTTEQGQTDARGEVAFRGFLGDHEIAVTFGDAVVTQPVTLSKDTDLVEITRGSPTSTSEAQTLPADFALSQNYPNPFNPATQIAFALPQAGPVRLAVYDVLGREVAVLVDEHLSAGTHEATFEATGLPSGVYLYRLEAHSFTRTQRMLLAK